MASKFNTTLNEIATPKKILPGKTRHPFQSFYWKINHVPRDQDTCGSCWAFAVAQCIELHAELFADISDLQLSVSDLLICSKDHVHGCTQKQCTGYELCAGGNPSDALDYLRGSHLLVEEDYEPYTLVADYFNNNTTSFVCAPPENRAPIQVESYGVIMKDSLADQILAMKEAIIRAPVVTMMWVKTINDVRAQQFLHKNWPRSWIYDDLDLEPHLNEFAHGYEDKEHHCGAHSVVLIGYHHPNDHLNVTDPDCFRGAYWIVYNSWGNSSEAVHDDLPYGTFKLQMGLGGYQINKVNPGNPHCYPTQLVEYKTWTIETSAEKSYLTVDSSKYHSSAPTRYRPKSPPRSPRPKPFKKSEDSISKFFSDLSYASLILAGVMLISGGVWMFSSFSISKKKKR